MFPLILTVIIIQLIGCTYHSTINGVDKTNSTKVSKVEFVKEYKSDYNDEEVLDSYKDTEGLFGQVYFKNVPDDHETKILFIWKDKNNEKTIATVDTKITESMNKTPLSSYFKLKTESMPNGTYILETYLKDTNELLNTTEIQVANQ